MTGFSRIIRAALLAALAAGAVANLSARAAVWRPVSSDSLSLTLELAETLLDRGVPELADDELSTLAPLPEQTPTADRERYGVLALRAALERGKLESREGRAETLQRVELANSSRGPDPATIVSNTSPTRRRSRIPRSATPSRSPKRIMRSERSNLPTITKRRTMPRSTRLLN